jgi:hypothetical protein
VVCGRSKLPKTMDTNMPRDLPQLLRSIHPVPGFRSTCWVSCYCFLPTALASGGIADLVRSAGAKLRVFKQTVLLRAELEEAAAAATSAGSSGGSQSTRITSVHATQRTPTDAGAQVRCTKGWVVMGGSSPYAPCRRSRRRGMHARAYSCMIHRRAPSTRAMGSSSPGPCPTGTPRAPARCSARSR